MKTLVTYIILSLLSCNILFSQEYFQQEVNHTISVTLNDKKHTLHCFEEIEYINNSPDNLEFIYFHLWPNAYKNRETALAKQSYKSEDTGVFFAEDKIRGYIDSLDFKIDSKDIKWGYHPNHIDICKLILNNPLKSGDTITITTPFFVKIPDNSLSRLGHHKNSYQITQWFPKPAVYDKDGWHQMPYLNMGEFYSEFGSYNVSITLPENYMVGATGNLITESEINWLNEKVKETEAITDYDQKYFEYPESSLTLKTIRFKEDNIHDFAWFADKRYHVLKSQVVLPHHGDTVNTWVMFTNKSANEWLKALEYVNDAVYNYSLWNGDYPYKNCSAIDGGLAAGGGMEYPTITVIPSAWDALSLEKIIMHEVGHNWFYGILGNNEREHPWLDEGLNSFYEYRYLAKKYPDLMLYSGSVPKNVANYFEFGLLPLLSSYEIFSFINARRNLAQPITLTSEVYSMMNYGGDVYMKSAFFFNYLKEYLGDDEFDRIMMKYYETWKFKHPQPEDLIKIFKENSTKNLDWFFDTLIPTTKHIDYKATKLKKDGDNYILTVKNKGKINSPVPISIIKDSTIISTKWVDGFNKEKTFTIDTVDFDKIILDAEHLTPDLYKGNNTIKRKGLLKKTEPLSLKLLGSFENPNKTQLFYMPVVGYNYYDKLMPGVLIYNSLIPIKRFEYEIMPMYGIGSDELVGYSKLSYNIFPEHTFQRITLTASANKYSFTEEDYFSRFKGGVEARLKRRDYSNPADNDFNINVINATDIFNASDINKTFYNFNYTHSYTGKINPYNLSCDIQAGEGFVKSSIEANYRFTYSEVKRGLDIRLFAGKFIYSRDEDYGNYNFMLSGLTGYQDYTYDNIFLGRSENITYNDANHFLSQQFVKADGGFSTYSYIGQTDDWLISVNASTTLPFSSHIKPFLNIATYSNIGDVIADGNTKAPLAIYEAGIELMLIKDILSIYFPVLMSPELRETSDFITDNYWQKVRFTLNLKKLYPFKYAKDFTL